MWYRNKKNNWYNLNHYRTLFLTIEHGVNDKYIYSIKATTSDSYDAFDIIEGYINKETDEETFAQKFLDILIGKICEREKKCIYEEIIEIMEALKMKEEIEKNKKVIASKSKYGHMLKF